MSDEVKGFRAVPPALVIALAGWFGFLGFRLAYILGKSEMWSPRLGLAGDGVSMACYTLALLGTLELARRSAGQLSKGAKIAAVGFALGLALEIVTTLMNFDLHIWEKKWLRDGFQYAYWLAGVLSVGGLAWAIWKENRVLAIVGLVVAVFIDPPPFLGDALFGGVKDFKLALSIDGALRIVRVTVMSILAIAASRGITPMDRPAGAEGLRLAARGMWLRVLVACSIVLLSLMAMGARGGGEGLFKMLRFMMMAGACATTIAFAMFGVGVARTAKASIADLPRYPLVLSAAASLWCCGVELSKLPYIYRMLYKSGDYGGYRDNDYMLAFTLAEPFVAIVAVALVAIAIGKFASERTTIALQSEAQGKGIGIVFMMLASLAIQNWMIPKAQSQGSVMMLMMLAAVAGLIAVVMIAKLCAGGAEEIEREPGLPIASVIPPSS
ncbi:MAG: hypothetical protein HOV81_32885 [Kofleriaceae bacterium]|nr:hypothetical protein [Kofleriaceae bacterium]